MTWVPTLIKEPFPGSVIDELRNKHSRYKRRSGRTAENKAALAAAKRGSGPQRERGEMRSWKKEIPYGGVLAEMSQRDQERRREEEKSDDIGLRRRGWEEKPMPRKHVLEMLGRQMVAAGVPLPSSSSAKSTDAGAPATAVQGEAQGLEAPVQKSIYVNAREEAAAARRERKEAMMARARYWPVKGWKERQREAAKQAQGAARKEEEKRLMRAKLRWELKRDYKIVGGRNPLVEARA